MFTFTSESSELRELQNLQTIRPLALNNPKVPINLSDRKMSLKYNRNISIEEGSYHPDELSHSLEIKNILKKTLEEEDDDNLSQKEEIISSKSDNKKRYLNFEENNKFNSAFKRIQTKISEKDFSKLREPSKMHRLISMLHLTRKFLSKLRNATMYRKPKWLKSFHFKMINDFSFFSDGVDNIPQIFDKKKKKNGFLSFLFNCIITFFLLKKLKQSKIIMKITEVIHPDQKFHVILDMLVLFVTIFSFFFVFLDAGFDMDFINLQFLTAEKESHAIIRGIFSVFLVDIILTFNTAYYEKGELIKSRYKIFQNYLKGNFIKDVMSLLYFIFGFFHSYPFEVWFMKFSCVFFLLRMRNIGVIFRRLEDFLFLDENYYNYLLFLKLIIRLVFIAHFFACFWHYIGMMEFQDGQSWLQLNGAVNYDWWKRYLLSFYYVAVVMNTVGFGDITPQNTIEMTFTVFFIYLACGTFAYTINSVGIIMQNINKNDREFKRNINLINGYMRKKDIAFPLRTKIRNYLEYVWKEEKIEDHNAEIEVISKLSKSLKEELLLNANGIFLKNFPLFQGNFSEDSLRKLTYEMKEINMTPGDMIYQQNDMSDHSLYIIKKGKVDLFVETLRDNDSVTVLQSLKKGELFGHLSFFSYLPRETSAKCSTFASFYVIKRQTFIEILKEHEEDYEVLCQIKDSITLYQEYQGIYLVCNSCKEPTHLTLNCPFLHLKLSNQRIIQKYNHSKPQERCEYIKRKLKKSINPRDKFYDNIMAAKRIYLDMSSCENPSLFSSNSISNANSEIDQVSSKNSIGFYCGSKENENNSSLEINEFSKIDKKNKKRKKPKLKSSTSLIIKNIKKNEENISDSSDNDDDEVDFFRLNQKNRNNQDLKLELVDLAPKKKLSNARAEIEFLPNRRNSNSRSDLDVIQHNKKEINSKSEFDYIRLKKHIKPSHSKENYSANLKSIDEISFDENSSISSNSIKKELKSTNEPTNPTNTINPALEIEKNSLYDASMKEYFHYFPHNNADGVILKVNELILKNIKEKRLLKLKSVRKSWFDFFLKKTLKSEDFSMIYKKKKSLKLKNTLRDVSFFDKDQTKKNSSISKTKIISILKENKIWNRKTGMLERIKNWLKNFF